VLLCHSICKLGLTCCAGYLPASLLAINAEVQRRIDARDSRPKQEVQEPEQRDESTHVPISAPIEVPMTFNASESMPPVFAPSTEGLAPSSFPSSESVASIEELSESSAHTSSSGSDLESEASAPIHGPQLVSHQPVGMTPSELVKLADLKAAAQQAQQHASAVGQQAPPAVGAVPVNVLAKPDSGKTAAPAEGKQRRKSKREKARGLLFSFTGGR